MNDFTTKYQENMCQFCSNYQSNNCNKAIIKRERDSIITTLCINYERNYDNEKMMEDITTYRDECAKPAKYYCRNYREV